MESFEEMDYKFEIFSKKFSANFIHLVGSPNIRLLYNNLDKLCLDLKESNYAEIDLNTYFIDFIRKFNNLLDKLLPTELYPKIRIDEERFEYLCKLPFINKENANLHMDIINDMMEVSGDDEETILLRIKDSVKYMENEYNMSINDIIDFHKKYYYNHDSFSPVIKMRIKLIDSKLLFKYECNCKEFMGSNFTYENFKIIK